MGRGGGKNYTKIEILFAFFYNFNFERKYFELSAQWNDAS